jgi:hypothetical protein
MNELPDNVATLRKPAMSPSGKYQLVIHEDRDSEATFQYFEILDTSGILQYSGTDRFFIRHTTVFLWGPSDRVWVYSGDVGTFYWELIDGGSWERSVYNKSGPQAPEYLKTIRPRFHPH